MIYKSNQMKINKQSTNSVSYKLANFFDVFWFDKKRRFLRAKNEKKKNWICNNMQANAYILSNLFQKNLKKIVVTLFKFWRFKKRQDQ